MKPVVFAFFTVRFCKLIYYKYAEEGTLAHELAEIHVKHMIGAITKRKFNAETKKVEDEITKFYEKNEPDNIYEKVEDMAMYVGLFTWHVEELYSKLTIKRAL